MNWDGVKYIFQIPIEWYRKIHNRVFNAYGTNFLMVREGFYGGTEIGIDSDGFAAEVKRIADLSSVVKSVDDVEPDEDGNVELCAAVLTADQTFTGNNTFSEPILLSAYGQLSAGAGDLRLTYGVNGIALSGNDEQLLVNEPARLYSTGQDSQIATRGYARLNFARVSHTHGNISNNGQITATPGTTPTDYYVAVDSSGNLYRKNTSDIVPSMSGYVTEDELTNYVQQSELTDYVQQSQLTDYVQHSELTDYVTQSELTDYVTQSELTDYVTQSELTDYVQHSELTDYVTQSELTGYATQQDIDDAIDAVEDELTAYARTDDFATGFPAATQNGKSVTNMKVVTDVTWDGTYLKYKYRNLSFSNGLLTAYTNETTLTVDTPTVITWV